jgi:calcineurin-like phosphoesterase family protein
MRLEKIADRQKRMARQAKSIPTQHVPPLVSLFKSIQTSYLDVMKAYYTNDVKTAYAIEINNRYKLQECDEFLTGHLQAKKTKDHGKECVSLALVTENLKAVSTSVKHIARSIMGNIG